MSDLSPERGIHATYLKRGKVPTGVQRDDAPARDVVERDVVERDDRRSHEAPGRISAKSPSSNVPTMR